MNSFWFFLFLICSVCKVTFSAREVHSGRIPANVEVLPKNELKRNHFRLIPSNEEGSPQQSSKLKSSEYETTVKLPPPLNDLDPEHKVLYLRALEKNYDYAQFGEPCKVFTVDELEAFLGIFEESIKPHEGETKSRAISPQEKAEQLDQLFFHSRAICDYRNLLTCNKQLLTCACAHPSMGVNRDGLCGINLGHTCEFSERTLRKYGILMMPEMSPIKCLLENAECEIDTENDLLGAGISPIRKVCKCRRSFWGATCGRTHDPAGIKLVPSKDQRKADKKYMMEASVRSEDLSEEMDLGQPIWMADGEMASSEYFMHPEEIRDKLVDLMNEANMYRAEYRKQEANKLVTSLETDVDKEEMVVNELRLRQLASLSHGETCDPESQVLLDNPPVAKDASHRWTDPHPQDIKSWHLALLQTKKPLCNLHRLLRCNEESKVCECKAGLELDPKGIGSSTPCKIPLGHNCDEDFDPILEFDPLKDRKRFSEMDPPSCMPGTECTDKPLFFQKKCWCSPQNSKCDKDFDENLYTSMVKAIKSRFLLGLGDSCDPQLHQRLLSYENDEDPGYKNRLQFFRDILDNPESQLCDIGSFLNCSDVSRTCECWKQLQPIQRENGDIDCVAMNMGSCGRTFKYGKYMYSQEDAQLWQVEKTLQQRFLPGCVPGALCTGGNDPEWAGRCLCTNAKKTGEICDDRKSILASAFRASRIPQNDDEEVATLRVYFDLNAHTLLMEQLMTAGINDVCDPGTGLTLDRIIKFWKEIASSNDSDTERRTLPYYIAATKWTKYLVSTVQGNSASLCNATVGLRCHRTTGRCGCHRGSRWAGDKCYLEVDEQCDPNPSAVWVTTCTPGTGCKAVGDRHYKVHKCVPCKPNKDGTCTKLYQDEDDEEDIWDTWNVKDDDKVEKKVRLTVSKHKIDSSEKVKPLEEKILQKREDGEHHDTTKEIQNYFVIKPANQLELEPRLDTFEHEPEYIDTVIIDHEPSPPARKVQKKPRGRSRYAHLKKDNLDDLNQHQKEAYIEEITRMLKEILEYRNIPFGEPCINEDEEKLTEIFPALPIYDMDHLPKSLPMVYIILSRLYWKGMSFCNRNHFLKCTNEAVCGCSFGFGLVEEDGECRLKTHSYCERELIEAGKRSIDFDTAKNNSRKTKYPLFQCQRGSTCVQIDYGLPVCVDDTDLDADGREPGKIVPRQLLSSNDDFPRSGNDNESDEEEQSGSSWTHEKIYSLGVAVTIRMVVSWAFV